MVSRIRVLVEKSYQPRTVLVPFPFFVHSFPADILSYALVARNLRDKGMAVNAIAPRNSTLRDETTLLFRQPTAPKNRTRAVVWGRVFPDAQVVSPFTYEKKRS